jgi:hypothetical protein
MPGVSLPPVTTGIASPDASAAPFGCARFTERRRAAMHELAIEVASAAHAATPIPA